MALLLSDITEFIIDTKHNTPEYAEEGYPCIRTPNIGRGYFILDNVKYVSEEVYLSWTERAVPRTGDTILAREAPVGNSAWVSPAIRPCIGQRTVLIRPNTKAVHSRYLTYLLLGDECQNQMRSKSGGATVAHLNMSDIRKLELPELPPLPTQRKIAAILSAYDDLIENNLRRIKVLEGMAQALYREWFVKFRFPGHEHIRFVDSPLGRIPGGWEARTLGEMADAVRESVDPESVDPTTPYLGLEHLPRKSITLSDWGTASEVQSTKLRFRKGDILFGKIRPYFHKVGVAPLVGVCSSDTIVIRSRSAEWSGLVLGCVSSTEFVEHATATSQGTKMPRANWDVLVKYSVPVPSAPLLDGFNGFMADVVSQLHNFVFRNRALRRTRDLLLPKLISGEVDVSELDIAVSEELAGV
ncbi:MAG: restriction endonuclease subunit S [Armatimonadetes bacterium]|nr:restriction endonuclease subunit S [Armatimonadota bacterium]